MYQQTEAAARLRMDGWMDGGVGCITLLIRDHCISKFVLKKQEKNDFIHDEEVEDEEVCIASTDQPLLSALSCDQTPPPFASPPLSL